MPTLLLRLSGPMQSWGLTSRFSIRDTSLEPTKSGVIGVLCAALGKPANERDRDGFPALAQLASLRMGVRVDREGAMARDYHTAGGGDWNGQAYGVYKASGKGGDPVVSTRYYLSGAHFLVGLEGPLDLLRALDQSLRQPVWQISLGRKSFVPSIPIYLPDSHPDGPGLREESLEDALLTVPLGHPLYDFGRGRPPDHVRFILDADAGSDALEQRVDVPLDFARRRFGQRRVRIYFKPSAEIATPRNAEVSS